MYMHIVLGCKTYSVILPWFVLRNSSPWSVSELAFSDEKQGTRESSLTGFGPLVLVSG